MIRPLFFQRRSTTLGVFLFLFLRHAYTVAHMR